MIPSCINHCFFQKIKCMQCTLHLTYHSCIEDRDIIVTQAQIRQSKLVGEISLSLIIKLCTTHKNHLIKIRLTIASGLYKEATYIYHVIFFNVMQIFEVIDKLQTTKVKRQVYSSLTDQRKQTNACQHVGNPNRKVNT